MERVGIHALVDLRGCPAERIAEAEALRRALRRAAERAGATVRGEAFTQFEPGGASGVLLLAESHLAVHTWPERGLAAADLFTCDERLDLDAAVEALREAFAAKEVRLRRIPRGDGAPEPIADETSPGERIVVEVAEEIFRARSRWQEIRIVRTPRYGRVLVLDGRVQSSESDEALYHEALVHPGLLLAPKPPRRVAILGGGEGATLREALRHASVAEAVMADIDGTVVEACARHLPEWSAGAFDDPRARVVFEDAALLVERERGVFDAVVSDLTDPGEEGPASALYGETFYEKVRDRLSPDGVLVVQAGLASGPDAEKGFGAAVRALRGVFESVLPYALFVPSFAGTWGFAIASRRTLPSAEGTLLERRARERLARPLRALDAETFDHLFALPRAVRDALDRD